MCVRGRSYISAVDVPMLSTQASPTPISQRICAYMSRIIANSYKLFNTEI